MRSVAYASVWILIFTMPWENMVIIPGIGTVSRLVGVIAFSAALLSVVVRREFRGIGITLGLIGLFVLWNMSTFFWTIDPTASQRAITTFLQLFIFVWLIWEFAREKEHQVGLLYAFLLGASISAFFTIQSFLHGVQVNHLRYAAAGFDPNDLGLTLALGLPMAFYLGLKGEGFFGRLIWLYIPAGFFAIVLTASRTSFVAAFLGFSVLLLISTKMKFRWKMAFVLLAAVSGNYFFPDESLHRIGTLGADLANGSLNYRTTIWEMGIRAFAESPLLGSGTGSFRAAVAPFLGIEMAPHNLFLDVMVSGGVIGLSILLLIMGNLFRCILALPTSEEQKMWATVYLIWGLGVMTLGWIDSKPTWFLFALLAAQGDFSLASRRRTDTGDLQAHSAPVGECV